MRVQVTDCDIKKGVRHDECRCPVARALERAIQGFSVEVSEDCIIVRSVNDISDYKSYLTPHSVAKFVRAFDASAYVEPFEFELDCEDL